jgi:predicted DNA binding protein
VGGWIEGLYIASELIGDNSIKDNKLVERVLEQKLSFNIVQRLLEDNKTKETGEQNEDIIDMIATLDDLKNTFESVELETTASKVEGKDEAGVSQIKSETTVDITPEEFKKLQLTIKELRNSFIQ